MARQQWYPKADRTTQTYDVTGRQMRTVNTFVLHTTEGSSWPGYNNNFPTFTYHPKTHQMRQHCPVDYAAKGLVSGTIRTNWNNCAQIEIIGTDGWNAQLAASGWHIKDIDDQAIKDLGDLIAWLHTEWEVPLSRLDPWWHGRLTDNEYINFYGILGHMHVPYNDHGDPGVAAPVDKILEAAKGNTPAPAPTPTPVTKMEEDMPLFMVSNDEVDPATGQVWAGAVYIVVPNAPLHHVTSDEWALLVRAGAVMPTERFKKSEIETVWRMMQGPATVSGSSSPSVSEIVDAVWAPIRKA